MSGSTGIKITGEFYFLCIDPPKEISGPHAAIVHLFEHVYDEKTKFWYGVADVACTAEEIDRAARASGVPDPPVGCWHNPTAFMLRVELEDGRKGLARMWAGTRFRAGLHDQHTQIPFVCESVLESAPQSCKT